MRVAIVHDYLTQRGGAERVLLTILRAFPRAPIYTSLYDPTGTYPEFGDADVRPLALNRISFLRRHHRAALPFLAPAFSRLRIDADVIVCSSSGWAHAARTDGVKIVYCYTPARWLYQSDRYLRERRALERGAFRVLRGTLERWDRRAAVTAHRYITSSTAVRDRIRNTYGREADVLPPPQTLGTDGPEASVASVEPGFYLCVSRLLPYKNVDAVVDAFALLPDERLVVVGTGPDEERLGERLPANACLTGGVTDAQMRWLYRRATGLVAASYEDYGLTPLEAASFGKPAAVLRFGGFRDTVIDGTTGVFFDEPTAADVADGIRRLRDTPWDEDALRRHADAYGEDRFVQRLKDIVHETWASASSSARPEPRRNGIPAPLEEAQ